MTRHAILAFLFSSFVLTVSGWGAEPAAPAPRPSEVSPTVAEKLIKEGKVTVIDVRTKDEFDEGHIAGAKNIDIKQADFEKQLASLDKSKSYLVHCQAGGRSKASMKFFEKLGFQSIFHLTDGILGWEEAGKPLQK